MLNLVWRSFFRLALRSGLKLGVARCTREGNYIADVFEAGEVHHHPFQPQPEPGVRHGAETAQVEIPPIGFFVPAGLPQPAQYNLIALFTLTAADDFADTRHEH